MNDDIIVTLEEENITLTLEEQNIDAQLELYDTSFIPSKLSDIVEVDTFMSLPETGLQDTIYITTDTNLIYRWSGTGYVEISKSLELGETQLTAHRGDYGKIAYDHSQLTSGNPHNVTSEDVGLGNVNNTSDSDKPVSTAQAEAIGLKADDSSVVHKSGYEIIDGDKEFTGKFALSAPIDNIAYGNIGKGFNANNNSYYENGIIRINSYFHSPFVSMGFASNLLLRSESFDISNWVKNNIGTVIGDSCLAPNGAMSAENIPAGSLNTSNISQTITNNVVDYVSAGVWVRMQSGTGTISLKIDSSAENGTEVSFDIDENWKFINIKQNLTQNHTTKTFRIITGTNAVSLWGAQMNIGQFLHMYRATTSAAYTPLSAVFFNNSTVYAAVFSGAFSGNSSTSTYTTGGLYSGGTLTNLTNKTDLWEYCGYIALTFNSTYSYGQSFTKRIMFVEQTASNSDTAIEDLEAFFVDIKVTLESVGRNSSTFSTTVPSISLEVFGKTNLTSSDIVAFVNSSSTSTKTIRLYVKLKTPNKHYSMNVISYVGWSYSKTRTATASSRYAGWVTVSSQPTVATLPAPIQGDYVYGNIKTVEDSSGNIYSPAHIIPGRLPNAPTTPIEGGVYYNTTDKHLYVYNGTEYKQLDN